MKDRTTLIAVVIVEACKLFCGLLWIAGLVLAQGFWSTLFALLCPLWGMYLVVELALTHWGII